VVDDLIVARRYRLGRPIGSGGMGRVWLAMDEVLRREVAIKEVLLPVGLTDDDAAELRLRTLREARTAGKVSHPNVIRVYDVIYAENRPWIVMEYVESRSLAQVLKEDGPLPPAEVARIGLAVLGALAAAHHVGVLHRDVKPGNVLLGDRRVVLTDFGLATFDDIGSALTASGIVHGSPQFIAPERAIDGTSTAAADMWSLGATLYAAVEGRAPYARASSYATLAALATAPPDPPRQAGALKPVLQGLLRRNPDARMKPDEVHALLRRIATSDLLETPTPSRESAVVQTPSTKSRRTAARDRDSTNSDLRNGIDQQMDIAWALPTAEGTAEPTPEPPQESVAARRAPLYARMLRLRSIRPGQLVCAVLFEGSVALAVVLSLAHRVSWYSVVVLPALVACLVKVNDFVADTLSRPRLKRALHPADRQASGRRSVPHPRVASPPLTTTAGSGRVGNAGRAIPSQAGSNERTTRRNRRSVVEPSNVDTTASRR
jgi:serine/threonine protein kinase